MYNVIGLMDMTSAYTPSYFYPYIYTTLLRDSLNDPDITINLLA